MPRKEEAEELKKELSGELIEYQLCKQIAGKLAEKVSFDGFTRPEMKISHDPTYSRSHDAAELVRAYVNAIGRGLRKKPPSKESFRAIVGKKIVSVRSFCEFASHLLLFQLLLHGRGKPLPYILNGYLR